MSSRPEDFIDPEFWGWYRSEGPQWLLHHRLDIINAMYEAYEDGLERADPVVMRPGAPFMFMGSPEEMQEFTNVLRQILPEAFGNPPPKKNKTPPISSKDIYNLKQKLDTIKLRRNNNEDNKTKQQ